MAGMDSGGFYGAGADAGQHGASPMGYGAAPRRLGAATPSYAGTLPQQSAPAHPAQPAPAQPSYAQPDPYAAQPQHPPYGGPQFAHYSASEPHYAPQPDYGYAQAYDEGAQGVGTDYAAYSTHVDDDPSGPSAANWIGALCSLAILLGLGFWGYQTIQRDVSGVPVIQALPGPMRIQPEDPGGVEANHQGLAVNNVQAEGQAAAPPDQIVLAPQPLDLSSEGISAATLPPVGSSQNGSSASLVTPPTNLSDAEQTAAYAALADQLAAGATQLSDPNTPVVSQTPEGNTVTFRVIPTSTPGVAQSPRPPARPASLRARAAATAAARPAQPVAATTGPYVDPETIAAGTRLVQFGAFDSPAIARSEWDRLSARFGDFLDGKRPVVQQALSGGREFHRLRVLGFADVAEARRFCSVFLAENTPCIPVVAK